MPKGNGNKKNKTIRKAVYKNQAKHEPPVLDKPAWERSKKNGMRKKREF